MSENFDPKLTVIDTEWIMSEELKNQVLLMKNLYINLQPLIPMLRLKIVSSDKYDRDLILNFLNIVETIPLKDLTEKEIINIMYNYNIDQIYIDKLELNMKNLIS
jgi:hypothetical protein